MSKVATTLYQYNCLKCFKILAYRDEEPEKCGKCGSKDLSYYDTLILA